MSNVFRKAIRRLHGGKEAPAPEAPKPIKRYRVGHFTPLPSPALCPLCGQETVSHVTPYPSPRLPFRYWTLFFCGGCGLGYVLGAAPFLKDYYESEYADQNRGDRQGDPARYFATLGEGRTSRYRNRAQQQLKRLRRANARFERILDYGSGPGYLLHESGGAELHAVEPDRASHPFLAHLGAQIHAPEALPDGYFDVIVASHVVEHLPIESVQEEVARLIRALRADGVLLVEVPAETLSRDDLRHRFDPHTLFFSPQALEILIERAGGQVIEGYFRTGGAPRPPRPDCVYSPKTDRAWHKGAGGGITVLVRRG